jgi:2-(1,2-epoxy-1,2-dihydrophenyl)acetyl-CoA isomerase
MSEVLLNRRDAVATVTLNRPDQLNAMNSGLLNGLVDTLETLNDDKDIRVIVIRGAGRAFCVGGDLAARPEPVGQSQAESRLRHWVRASEILREGHTVSIAAVNGAAAGAGFSLAAACDLRIVAESAVFRSAFLTAAMSGDFGLGWSLTHLLGGARASQILLLNEKISASDALDMGLATRVHPADEFEEGVRAVADALAAGPPLAMAGIQANLGDAARLPFTECLRRECARHIATGHSADAKEAGRAFLKKRAPQFRGE